MGIGSEVQGTARKGMESIGLKPNPFAERPRGHFAALDVDNATYHRDCDGISNSMLTTFLDDPQLFFGRYISGEYPAPPPTPEMEFGSLVHAVLLEGVDPMERLLGDVTIIPRDALNDKGFRMGPKWKAYAAENAGRKLLKEEEIAELREQARTVEAMRQRVLADDKARELICESRGANEYGIEFVDEATGLLLRARLDRLAEYGGPLIVDLKTTTRVDTESCQATCWKYRYNRQGALYRRAVKAIEGVLPPFVVVAMRKTPPYSVACVELSESFLELGEQELDRALSALARCRDTGRWEPPTAHSIFQIDAPRWAKYSYSDWSFAE